MLKRYLKLFSKFLRDPLWTLEYFFEYEEGKNFKYAENALQAIAAIKERKTKTGKLLASIFQFIKSPLQHLSRYFHTGKGQNLKYAKQARQTIAFIQNGKSQIGNFLSAAYRFVKGTAFPWIGKVTAWLFKAIITTTSIFVAGYVHWEVVTNKGMITSQFELRWWEFPILFTIELLVLSMFVSAELREAWNLRNYYYTELIPISVLIVTIVSPIIGLASYLLTAPH